MTDLKSVLFRNQATCQISSESVQLFRREKMTDRQTDRQYYFKILVGMDNNWITTITFDFNHTIWYFYNTVTQQHRTMARRPPTTYLMGLGQKR